MCIVGCILSSCQNGIVNQTDSFSSLLDKEQKKHPGSQSVTLLSEARGELIDVWVMSEVHGYDCILHLGDKSDEESLCCVFIGLCGSSVWQYGDVWWRSWSGLIRDQECWSAPAWGNYTLKGWKVKTEMFHLWSPEVEGNWRLSLAHISRICNLLVYVLLLLHL